MKIERNAPARAARSVAASAYARAANTAAPASEGDKVTPVAEVLGIPDEEFTPRVRDAIERVKRKLRGARLATLKAAWLLDHRRTNIVESSMAKILSAEIAQEAGALGMEIVWEGRARHAALFDAAETLPIAESDRCRGIPSPRSGRQLCQAQEHRRVAA